ncbi:hypothetical protein BDV32DRAFT_128822 [Aspergillus pseudonomiae]|uniref:Uncharacterized protein n=1 Tax=Aspergillus pseudonomiae TaxID=1506151 RepID=A0A5N6HV10_9EURO|nr:uncharacterized protein BDV37DRAFT_258275 [Aspergillus pseudonomiae]KAB8256533.1 hypothetical protein BDV32DRAFT_128822 [Aspergillus pseudonomiae]KAE8400190.1 hypothetical protein BDV37DRAFT_258275 [Aspergillus pseudonomiae]
MKLLSSLSIIFLASAPLAKAWTVAFYSSHNKCHGWQPGGAGDNGRPRSCEKLEDNWWSAEFKSHGEPYNIVFWKGKNCDGEYYTPGSAPHSCSDLEGMHSYAVLKRK